MAIANDGENLNPTTKDTIITYYFTYYFNDVSYSHILLQVNFQCSFLSSDWLQVSMSE